MVSFDFQSLCNWKTFKNDLIFSNLDFISSEGQEIFKGVSGSAKVLSNRIYIKLDQIITNDRFFPINERSSADLDKLSEFATLSSDGTFGKHYETIYCFRQPVKNKPSFGTLQTQLWNPSKPSVGKHISILNLSQHILIYM